MLHQSKSLKERRDQQRAIIRRRRLIAGGAILGTVGLAAVAVAIGSGSGSSSTATAGGRTATGAAAKSASQPTRNKADAWMQPLATPAQQNAAVDRVVKVGKPVYCAGGHRGRYVALTFDDGPGLYTHFAIKKLKQWKLRATFFLIGRLLEQPEWQAWARRETVLAAIGNHSWSHPYLPGLGIDEVHTQLADTLKKAEATTGKQVRVFRPPYGARTDAIDRVASQLGMAQIIWDVDSRDSLGANWAGIAKNVNAGLRPGAIILMHDNRGQTIRALPYILPQLKRRNLTAVTVPELLALDPPSDRQLAAGPNGCGNLRGAGTKISSGA
ncbi:MAG: polysaccharide deacetylase family protein [Actinomycetes bacterium]